MSVLLALVMSLCAAAAVLFVAIWLDGDSAAAALAFALLPLLVLTVMAWGKAL